ncbi:hypothetical protein [Haloferax sp. DFSO60]|uniref:hypothetical protein n=1 Tax=Haloferax sp. DFSO60 TaxID=3388652 RepID=UPI00397B5A63
MFGSGISLLSGCQRLQSEPAGSLLIENGHDLPHIIDIEIVSYSENGEIKTGSKTGEIPIESGDTKRYPEYFDLSASYEVIASIPGAEAVRVPYGRGGTSKKDNLVLLTISADGTFSGGLKSV